MIENELNISIRPIKIEDAPAMHAMRIMPGVQETISAVYGERVTFCEEYIKSLGNNDFSFVAEVDTDGVLEVIGSVAVSVNQKPRKRHVGLLGIMVHTQWQRKGIGKRLMEYILDFADNWLMLTRMELTVHASNEHAIRLYRSFGFEVEGRLKFAIVMNGSYTDELMMGRVV